MRVLGVNGLLTLEGPLPPMTETERATQSSDRWKSQSLYLVFCVALLSLAFADLRLSWQREETVVRERLEVTTYLIGEWVKGAFTASDYVLRDIIEHIPVDDLVYPHPDPVRHQRQTELADARRLSVPYATSFGLNNADCIVTHTAAVLGFDASEREWCAVPKADLSLETYVSSLLFSNNYDHMVIQVRRFPGPGFTGLAGIGVGLGFFSEWLERVSTPRAGVLAIVDTETHLLARKPSMPDLLGQPQSHFGLDGFIASGNQITYDHSFSQLDGIKRLWAVRRVEGLPFLVLAGEAHDVWLADWYQRVIRVSAIVLLCLLLGFMLLRKHLAVLRQQDELLALAQSDPLTGLANRRHFNDLAESERLRARRYGRAYGVLVIDIDNFKDINDTYGHAAGDAVINRFADICKSSLREIDVLGRMGGDEFAALLPDITEEDARLVARRVRENVESHVFEVGDGRTIRLTTSIGGAVTVSPDDTVDALMTKADAALYRAKRDGRNSTEF